MIQNVYSVFDRKAISFGALIFFVNDDMAKRGVADLMRAGGDGPMFMYPEDFALYRVGAFNQDNGLLLQLDAPLLVCSMDEFKAR